MQRRVVAVGPSASNSTASEPGIERLAAERTFLYDWRLEDHYVPLTITNTLLLHYQRCRRRAFLDVYGDQMQRDPASDYLQKLQQDSLSHQQQILAGYSAHQPCYLPHDWQAGAEATLELMRTGVSAIVNGVVRLERSDGTVLVGRPKLLVRQPGWSDLGDWCYHVIDIKLGKRPKADYQIVSAFHTYLLAETQGAWPETSWLILKEGKRYAVNLVNQLPKMEETLTHCIESLRMAAEPDVFIARNRCDLCQWFSQCYQIAQQKRHLSLLPGVTPNRYVYLKELMLTTVEQLSKVSSTLLEPLPGFGPQVANKLVRQAQSAYQNRALPVIDAPSFTPEALAAFLPTAPVELYFDIEAAPERELMYLHGVLVVERDIARNASKSTFHAFFAELPEQEGTIWRQFLSLTHRYPTAPIYHFCPYEAQAIQKLAELYGTPSHRVQWLLKRFVDLHDRVIQTATLPTESYALKSIARWVGFDWRDEGANGAQSIFWYDQWVTQGDRNAISKILRYNEDDCRATWQVKDWLVAFLQQHCLTNQSNRSA
ncbi:MAG: TM0106 family RecB-like putative nuclease [Elainellaceae cyanobacterium]